MLLLATQVDFMSGSFEAKRRPNCFRSNGRFVPLLRLPRTAQRTTGFRHCGHWCKAQRLTAKSPFCKFMRVVQRAAGFQKADIRRGCEVTIVALVGSVKRGGFLTVSATSTNEGKPSFSTVGIRLRDISIGNEFLSSNVLELKHWRSTLEWQK